MYAKYMVLYQNYLLSFQPGTTLRIIKAASKNISSSMQGVFYVKLGCSGSIFPDIKEIR